MSHHAVNAHFAVNARDLLVAIQAASQGSGPARNARWGQVWIEGVSYTRLSVVGSNGHMIVAATVDGETRGAPFRAKVPKRAIAPLIRRLKGLAQDPRAAVAVDARGVTLPDGETVEWGCTEHLSNPPRGWRQVMKSAREIADPETVCMVRPDYLERALKAARLVAGKDVPVTMHSAPHQGGLCIVARDDRTTVEAVVMTVTA